MKRIVRLSESDLTRIIRRVISEQTLPKGCNERDIIEFHEFLTSTKGDVEYMKEKDRNGEEDRGFKRFIPNYVDSQIRSRQRSNEPIFFCRCMTEENYKKLGLKMTEEDKEYQKSWRDKRCQG